VGDPRLSPPSRKTTATLNDMIMRALQCKLPRPRYAFIFPLRNQAKDATWTELKFYTEGMWASRRTRTSCGSS
jgi:hypothetical protein